VLLDEWAQDHGISSEALADLRRRATTPTGETATRSGLESEAQALTRLDASAQGVTLWRNNVGAVDSIRYGLCNESKRMNLRYKSSDLVGITPVQIQPGHVGHTIGQFTAREVKRQGWQYKATGREVAQLAWIELVNSLGGDAKFSTGRL
jgi:hypothetical protein